MQKQLNHLGKNKFQQIIYLVVAVTLILISCNDKSGDGAFIPIPKDSSALGRQDHFIPLNQIKNYQASFNSERDSLAKLYPGFSIPFSESFNKKALIELLQLPDCVGVTVLYGTNQRGKNKGLRLILVGVDSQGKYLYLKNSEEKAAEKSEPNNKDTANKNANLLKGAPDDDEGGIEHGVCNPPCQY